MALSTPRITFFSFLKPYYMQPIKIKKGYYKLSLSKNFFANHLKKQLHQKNSGASRQRPNVKGNSVFFHAENVEKLKKQQMTYLDAYKLFHNIGNQLKDLERNYNHTIPFFSLSDIVKISTTEEDFFIFTNETKILEINEETIIINQPFQEEFFSPELKNMNTLPCKISVKSGIFSLAAVVTFLLNNTKLTESIINKGFFWKTQQPPKQNSNINSLALLLGSIYNTKLYWALERCLNNDPDKRFLYFI